MANKMTVDNNTGGPADHIRVTPTGPNNPGVEMLREIMGAKERLAMQTRNKSNER